MKHREIILGLAISSLLIAGCTTTPQTLPSASVSIQTVPPRSIPIHYKRDLPRLMDRVEFHDPDGREMATDAQAAYATARRDGWFECLDLFLEGSGELPEIPAPASFNDALLSLQQRARIDGWKRCVSDLRTAIIDHATSPAALRLALAPPAWFERTENWFNAPLRYSRLDKGEFDLQFASAFPQPYNRLHAMEILLKTTEFTDAYVGIGPEVPRQVKSFNRIRAEPDAAAAFADLLKRGQTPGRLFALAGLYLTDRSRYAREVVQFDDSDEYVPFHAGCVIDHVSAKRLKERIPRLARTFAGLGAGDEPTARAK